MHALVYWLLNTSTLPPEIDTAVCKDNKAFITRLNRKSQRTASATRENDRNVHQQWEVYRYPGAGFVLLCAFNGWLNNSGDSIRIKRLNDASMETRIADMIACASCASACSLLPSWEFSATGIWFTPALKTRRSGLLNYKLIRRESYLTFYEQGFESIRSYLYNITDVQSFIFCIISNRIKEVMMHSD